MDRKRNKRLSLGTGVFILSTLSASCFALPFSIVPNGTLPTSVPSGSTVTASYIVTNLTGVTLNNNVVKTPPNVTSNGCSPSLSLAPHASCTLSLSISGAVNKNNTSNADHLFVCLQDGITCAGPTPDNSLNVSVTTGSRTRVGVGYANISSSGNQPIVYTSSNNGVSWNDPSVLAVPTLSKYLAHLIKPMGGGSTGKLLGVACSTNGSTCATVGVASSTVTPLGFYTTNSGSSWNAANFTLPTGTDFTMYGVACDSSGLLCVAVGQYTNSNARPLSFTSTDGGITWNNTNPTPPTLLSNDIQSIAGATSALYGVTCSANGLNCIAVGTTTAGGSGPLVYTTSNGGSNWNAAQILSSALNTQNKNSTLAAAGALYGVACSSDGVQCTAVGIKLNSNPLTYTTNNSGTSWTAVPPNPPSLLMPTRQGNKQLIGASTLVSVACSSNGMNCITVGNTTFTGPTTTLVYKSSDGGASWGTFTSLTAPAGSTDTRLSGITCDSSGSLCTAVGTATISGVKHAISYSTSDGGTTWETPITLTDPTGATLAELNCVSGSK